MLFTIAGANEDKTLFLLPTIGLPLLVEKAAALIQMAPAFPSLYDALQFGESLERHADGELNPLAFQTANDGIRKESAIHPHFDDRQ